MRTRVHRACRAVGSAMLFALAVVACGDSGSSGEPNTGDATTTSAAPRSGGTLTMAMFQETAGLDPIVSSGSGTTGATEMAAIYDTLLRWNPKTGEYEPHTAASLTSNASHTVWTLKIKPGIKFTDGTDYDADAVKFGLDRIRAGQTGAPPCEEVRACPRNDRASRAYMTSVSDIRVVDKLTVEISLRDPWPGFPVVLSDEPGMIPSPTAMKQACPADKNAAPKDCSFNLKPVGAGPFVIDEFKPKDSITMKRNPAYWDGPVYLDGLKFVSFGDGGGDRTVGFLKGGNVDVAFLRDAVAVASAKADGYAGFSQIVHSGQVEFMNNGTSVTCSKGQPAVCAGRADGPYTPPTATSDARVREAIAAAIDAKQLDQRVTGGRGLPSSEMFQKSFRYYPNVPGPAYDVAKAKQLVQAAKDAGWDGKVRYLCNSSAPAVQRALGIQAMLQAAGMTVEIQNSFDINAQQQRFIAGDFDINCGGMNMTDHSDRNPARSLANNLASAGNRIGYKSADMDAALDALRAAATDAEKTAAYKRISEIYTHDVPMLVTAAVEEYVAWNGKVHDVYGTTATRVEFTKAWLSN